MRALALQARGREFESLIAHHFFAEIAQLVEQLTCIANSGKPKAWRIMNCLNCNEIISEERKFCSNYCQKQYEYTLYISRWKEGIETGMKGKYQISNYIRRYLYTKYDSRCAICGWNEINPYTGIVPLEIEHIDGNYLNNSEENLILLCPNCHSLTATYKGANKNGRKERKKYSLYGNPELGSNTECRDFTR